MADNEIATTLKTADPDLVDEIMREAEARLDAQLTAALAADQRAMTFLGFLLTLVSFLVGAALAVLTAGTPSPRLAVVAAIGAAGFMLASVFAFIATRPIAFEFVGNDPDGWVDDARNRVALTAAKAEQCAHYDRMLKSNRASMSASSAALRWSSFIAAGTVVVSVAAAVIALGHTGP